VLRHGGLDSSTTTTAPPSSMPHRRPRSRRTRYATVVARTADDAVVVRNETRFRADMA
jgi:hypothetical protein